MQNDIYSASHVELSDTETIKLLICYLMSKINTPISDSALYDVTVGGGLINYFFYTDAVASLIKHEVILADDSQKEKIYSLSDKGKLCAEKFKFYVPKFFRDKIVAAAVRYFARLRIIDNIHLDYIKTENGYLVHFMCDDSNNELINIKLFAPDLRQAELIGNNILKNPTDFYSNIINYALNNKEEEIDLTNN